MSTTTVNIITTDAVVGDVIKDSNDAARSGDVYDKFLFEEKNWLSDKSLAFTTNELVAIDAIYDVRCTKVPIGEENDLFGIIALYGSAHASTPFRVIIRNITTGINVFETYTSTEHITYYGNGLSLITTPLAGIGTHEFQILIDWNKIPPTFSYLDSLSQLTFHVNPKFTNKLSKVSNISSIFGSDLEGKDWSVWGDSISPNFGSWVEGANQLLAMNLDGHAVGGDTISDQVDDLDALLSSSPNHFNNTTLLSLMAIYNSYNNGYALGSASDSTATASYCGKLKYFIETVLTANKFVSFVLMTQYITNETPNANGDKLRDFNEKTREIASLYGIPLVDWGAESTCNPINAGTAASPQYDRLFFTRDGVHPSRIGDSILFKQFVKKVVTTVSPFF